MGHNGHTYGYFLVLFVVAVGLFVSIFLEQRNYQDLWVLDGIVVPTAIFIFFFIVVETFVKENKKVVIIAASLLAVMNLIPGLKYQFFTGVFDAPAHFRFTDQIASSGFIPQNEHISAEYSANPSMHIFLASVSIITGMSTNDVFRLIVPALSGLVPFLIYFISKDILDSTIQRYAIIASSFPVVQRYIVYGTSLALLPYFSLMAVFVRHIFTKESQKAFLLVFAILSFNLVTSHAITALFVSFVFLWTLIALKVLEFGMQSRLIGKIRVSNLVVPSLLYLGMFWAWWLSVASYNLNTFADFIQTLLFGGPFDKPIPSRFYSVSVLSKLRVLTVFHLRDAILIVLSLCGLLVFLRRRRSGDAFGKSRSFYMFLIVLLSPFAMFLLFEFVSGFGRIEYGRFIAYALPLCVFLIGLVLWRFDESLSRITTKPKMRNLAFAFFVFILVSSSLIQFYRFQPLVPRSNTLSNDLPEDEYITYFGIVNTIYQIKMISFADTFFDNGKVTSDEVTRYQIHGFSSPSFFSKHIFHSPLEPGRTLKWDLLLLHTLRAGHFMERAEYRTRQRIESFRLEAGNLIYDNGESFVMLRHP